MAKINYKSKKFWKKILMVGLSIILGIGAIAGITALVHKSEETTKVVKPTYSIGGLTEDGAYLETEESIYTKDAFECGGLDVDIAFDNNISYQIFFYDEDGNFLTATSKLTENFDGSSISPLSSTARIVITPNEDDEVKWYEKNGYANQLTISVDKEQEENTYGKNVYQVLSDSNGTYYVDSLTQTSEMGAYVRSTIIDVKDYSKVLVMCSGFSNDAIAIAHLANGDANKTIVEGVELRPQTMTQFGNIYYVEIDLTDDICYFAISGVSGINYFVYLK